MGRSRVWLVLCSIFLSFAPAHATPIDGAEEGIGIRSLPGDCSSGVTVYGVAVVDALPFENLRIDGESLGERSCGETTFEVFRGTLTADIAPQTQSVVACATAWANYRSMCFLDERDVHPMYARVTIVGTVGTYAYTFPSGETVTKVQFLVGGVGIGPSPDVAFARLSP